MPGREPLDDALLLALGFLAGWGAAWIAIVGLVALVGVAMIPWNLT